MQPQRKLNIKKRPSLFPLLPFTYKACSSRRKPQFRFSETFYKTPTSDFLEKSLQFPQTLRPCYSVESDHHQNSDNSDNRMTHKEEEEEVILPPMPTYAEWYQETHPRVKHTRPKVQHSQKHSTQTTNKRKASSNLHDYATKR